MVYLSGSTDPLAFTRDHGHEPAADFKMLLDGLQLHIEAEEFVSFEDADGETVFLRTTDIVLIDTLAWTVDASISSED